MSEMSFGEMLDESFKVVHNGDVVEGTVISVKPEEIILNIGTKSDGVIPKSEYSGDNSLDLTTVCSVDDTMEAVVVKVNETEGITLLSHKRLAQERGNKRLEEAYEKEEVLKAPVVQVLKGGLSVSVEESRVFIPASLVSDTYEKDLGKYQGQEIEFVITEFNPRKRRIIGNRKMLLVAEREKRQEEILARIEPGEIIEGVVKNVTNFGAFIDLGGIDGLMHISEMSWGRVSNPDEALKNGDKVKVFIKSIDGRRIALSRKFPEENPWNDAGSRYAVGNIVTGRVARMADFGAFVELAPGVDALLHVSQIAKEHVEKPSDVLKVGEEVTAKIVEFRTEDRKISLSIKALTEDNEDSGDKDFADVNQEELGKILEDEAKLTEAEAADKETESETSEVKADEVDKADEAKPAETETTGDDTETESETCDVADPETAAEPENGEAAEETCPVELEEGQE